MSTKQTGGGSLFLPENAVEGGGRFDDADIDIIGARVITGADLPFDEAGDDPKCYVALRLRATEDTEGEGSEEFYGVGKLETFTPSQDGSRMIAEEGKHLNKAVKFMQFMTSLIAAGFDPSNVPADNSVGFLVGLRAHVNRVAMANIKGGKKLLKADGTEAGPGMVLVVTKLLETAAPPTTKGKPAAKAAAAPKAAGKPAAAAPVAAVESAGDIDATVESKIVELIGERDGAIFKKELPNMMMAAFSKEPKVRSASFKLVNDNTWLGSEDRPWKFDAGSLALSLG